MTVRDDVFYEEYVKRGHEPPREDRLERIVAAIPPSCGTLLDVGCGVGRNLLFFHAHVPGAVMYGTDIAVEGVEAVKKLGFNGAQCDASVEIPYPDASFDVVVCGEVIEHVVNTDRLARELRRVVKPGGKVIVTTPNLAYAVNRVLLLFGIQPIFTETSYQKNLGRRFRFLGQGNETQGHLKIFTARALVELLQLNGLRVERVQGYRMMQSGAAAAIDGVLARVPSLAAGLIAEARRDE